MARLIDQSNVLKNRKHESIESKYKKRHMELFCNVVLGSPTADDVEKFERLGSDEEVISEWEATPPREVAIDRYLDWAAVQQILLWTGRSRRGSVGTVQGQKKKRERAGPSSVR